MLCLCCEEPSLFGSICHLFITSFFFQATGSNIRILNCKEFMVMLRDISEGTGIPTGNYGTHFFCRGGTYFTIVSGILDDIASVLGD